MQRDQAQRQQEELASRMQSATTEKAAAQATAQGLAKDVQVCARAAAHPVWGAPLEGQRSCTRRVRMGRWVLS